MTDAAARERQASIWRLVQPGEQAFAIVDGAAAPDLIHRVRRSGRPQACLYQGAPEPLALAAPHLVHLAAEGELTEWLLGAGWDRAWGILALGPMDLEELRRQLRRLLRVRTEDGQVLHFRFYDPRVWRVFLPTCNDAELSALFGRVSTFLGSSDEADGRLLLSRWRPGRLSQTLWPPRPAGTPEERVLELLPSRIATFDEARRVWREAGGSADDLLPGLSAPGLWRRLWERVALRGRAGRLALLRALLREHPGEPALLDALSAEAVGLDVSAAEQGLASWRAAPGPGAGAGRGRWPRLDAAATPDEAFACLTIALRREARGGELDRGLRRLPVEHRVRTELGRLLDAARRDGADPQALLEDVTTTLTRLARSLGGPDGGGGPCDWLDEQVGRLAGRAPSPRSIKASLLSLQARFGAPASEPGSLLLVEAIGALGPALVEPASSPR